MRKQKYRYDCKHCLIYGRIQNKKVERKLERYVGKQTHAHTNPPKKQEHSLKNMQAMAKEAFHHFSTIL